jgi:hypothetical protein
MKECIKHVDTQCAGGRSTIIQEIKSWFRNEIGRGGAHVVQ